MFTITPESGSGSKRYEALFDGRVVASGDNWAETIIGLEEHVRKFLDDEISLAAAREADLGLAKAIFETQGMDAFDAALATS